MRAYRYVGPAEIREQAHAAITRLCPKSQGELSSSTLLESSNRVDLTFIVDLEGRLWLSDRRTEHVACAQGADVLAAGEMSLLRSGCDVTVVEITNQSTGYCPEPDCWTSVCTAVAGAGLVVPTEWTHAFNFRRCTVCGATNILKESYPECGCGAELPESWNFGA